MLSDIQKKHNDLINYREYDDLGKYKINADYVRIFAREESYRELMVSYYQMLPLLEHTVSIEKADYVLYMHAYARCDDLSAFVVEDIKRIAEKRKKGATIIVLGKAANAEKFLGKTIPNIIFWRDHFIEKLGKMFEMDIKEQYFVYDDIEKHLAIWPVNGCLNKCAFCRRCYMDIKFESLSLDVIKANLDQIKLNNPEQMKKISLRAENLTEYGLDIYGKQMLHELIYLIDSYDEVKEIELPIGVCIGEIYPELLEAFCYSKKFTYMYMNIETGSDRLLKLIGKKHTSEMAREIFGRIHKDNPKFKLCTTIMLGLPTENIGDVLETAKLIADIKPFFVHCNFFVCSPNVPLSRYPQKTEKCKEYHLKNLITFLHKMSTHSFEMGSRHIDNKPNSKCTIEENAELDRENKGLEQKGLFPLHHWMTTKFN